MKLTKWYPTNTKPVRKGVYETILISSDGSTHLSSGYSLWTGEHWNDTRHNASSAAMTKGIVGLQRKMWRGLKDNPNGSN